MNIPLGGFKKLRYTLEPNNWVIVFLMTCNVQTKRIRRIVFIKILDQWVASSGAIS